MVGPDLEPHEIGRPDGPHRGGVSTIETVVQRAPAAVLVAALAVVLAAASGAAVARGASPPPTGAGPRTPSPPSADAEARTPSSPPAGSVARTPSAPVTDAGPRTPTSPSPSAGARTAAAPLPPAAAAAAEVIVEKPLTHEELCAPGTSIGDIDIARLDVFDTAEPAFDHGFYRVVNMLHRPMKTRLNTVRSLLTVEQGEPCSLDALEEAERVLRGLSFIQDAWIVPVARRGDVVDLEVRVQDAWSTRLGVSYSNEGGSSETLLRIKETNFLGTGSRLTWTEQSDQDRDERVFQYQDPALGRSRWALDLLASDNSDGDEQSVEVKRPFYRLDARWSMRAGAGERMREEKVYVADAVVDRWQLDGQRYWLGVGIAPGGYRDGRLLRLEFGLRSEQQSWLIADPADPVDRPDLRPFDRDLVYASVSGSWLSADYRRVQYLETAKRVEDIDLSQRLDFAIERSIASASKGSGSLWYVGYQRGFQPFGSTFVVLGASTGIERLDERWINAETTLRGRLYRKLAYDQTMVLDLEVTRGEQLEGNRRYLLGGDTGLRGYPTRSLSGDRRVLLSGEHRYFAPWELFGVVRLGLVGFFDAGAAWDGRAGFDSRTVGGNVGVGLRGFLRPSSGDTTVHLNVTYAVGGALPEDEDRWQLSVSTESTF